MQLGIFAFSFFPGRFFAVDVLLVAVEEYEGSLFGVEWNGTWKFDVLWLRQLARRLYDEWRDNREAK